MTDKTADAGTELAEQTDVKSAVEKALAPLKRSDATIDELALQLKGKTIDCTTREGDKEARASRRVLLDLRTGVEKLRVALKAPHLEAGRAIDTEAKRITGRILELETPIATLIDAEKARQDAIEAEKAAAEQARRKLQIDRVDAIQRAPLNLIGQTTAQVEQALSGLQAHDFSDMDDDIAAQAEQVRRVTIGHVEGMLERLREQDRQAAVLAEQAAENERVRQEAEQRAAERRERDKQLQTIRDFGRGQHPLDTTRAWLDQALAPNLSGIHPDDHEVATELWAQTATRLAERIQLLEQQAALDAQRQEQDRIAEQQAEQQRIAEAAARRTQQIEQQRTWINTRLEEAVTALQTMDPQQGLALLQTAASSLDAMALVEGEPALQDLRAGTLQRVRMEATALRAAIAKQHEEAEAAAKREEAELEASIRTATLTEAAREAQAFIAEEHGDSHPIARKLASALSRTVTVETAAVRKSRAKKAPQA